MRTTKVLLLLFLLSDGGGPSGIAEARSSSSSSQVGSIGDGGAARGRGGFGPWGWGKIGGRRGAATTHSSPFQPSSVAPTMTLPLPPPGTICRGGICRPRVTAPAVTQHLHPSVVSEGESVGTATTSGPAMSSDRLRKCDLRGGATRTTTPDPFSEGGEGSPPPLPVESTAMAAAEAPEGTEVAAASAATVGNETTTSVGDSSSADRPEVEEVSSDHHHDHHTHHPETRAEKRRRLKRHKLIAKQLKNRNARNLRRKVMHACFGLTFACLNHWLPKTTFVPAMATLSSATLLMELLRYRKGFGWMNAVLHGVLGQSLRKHEMEGKFTGSFYFFTGVTLTSWWFDSTAATLGICQLALADPSASYFGRKTRHIYWSRIENGFGGFGRNKGVLGFLGGALFCFPFNYRVLTVAARRAAAAAATTATSGSALPFSPVPPTTLAAASLLLGLAGALADLAVPTPAVVLPKRVLGLRVPPFHIDDNTVVPLFSAYACQQIFGVLKLSHLPLSPWLVV